MWQPVVFSDSARQRGRVPQHSQHALLRDHCNLIGIALHPHIVPACKSFCHCTQGRTPPACVRVQEVRLIRFPFHQHTVPACTFCCGFLRQSTSEDASLRHVSGLSPTREDAFLSISRGARVASWDTQHYRTSRGSYPLRAQSSKCHNTSSFVAHPWVTHPVNRLNTRC